MLAGVHRKVPADPPERDGGFSRLARSKLSQSSCLQLQANTPKWRGRNIDADTFAFLSPKGGSDYSTHFGIEKKRKYGDNLSGAGENPDNLCKRCQRSHHDERTDTRFWLCCGSPGKHCRPTGTYPRSADHIGGWSNAKTWANAAQGRTTSRAGSSIKSTGRCQRSVNTLVTERQA